VPARGGSKSIPRKNLVPLAGRPLLDYGVRATQAAGWMERIVCSTDDDAIAARAIALGIEVARRPAELATDEAKVADVAREFLATEGRRGRAIPDVLVLVQPTSPFLRPTDVVALMAAMDAAPTARSGQTVTRCPHNHHAWNQRELADGRVRFRYAQERARGYNKQTKPANYVFGNLVAIRCDALMSGEDFFAEPSVGVEIESPHDFDLDKSSDIAVANALIAAGQIDLSHLDIPTKKQQVK
jgi:N-acylneuraminate cytidylyltransferase/CMP-N,N'-diacetyllegionaminic acid synthase